MRLFSCQEKYTNLPLIMEPGMPPSRATILRPTLLVPVGLVVLAAAAGFALHDRNILQAPPGEPPPQAAAQPQAHAGAPPAQKPSFDVVRINPQGNAVMAGRAAPGSEVTIADAGKAIGHVQADQHGDWVFVPSTPLPPGARELTLAERAPNGSETKGDRSVLLVMPRVAAAGTAPAQSAAPPLAVLTGPNTAPLVLTGPAQPAGAAAAGHARLAFGAVEYDEHGKTRLSGIAPPGAKVRLYVDNHPIGEAAANPDGQWTFSASQAIGTGSHHLRLDQIAPNGAVAFRLDRPFTREQLTAAELRAGDIVIQPGQNLWVIARHTYGLGTHYLVIYQEIRDPDLIYPGQVFTLPASTEPTPMPASSSKSR
jgi:nucleoid-associated protein YgaU